MARHADQDVSQGHDDLGVLFAGRDQEHRPADQHRDDDQDDREVVLEENMDDPIQEIVSFRLGRAMGAVVPES